MGGIEVRRASRSFPGVERSTSKPFAD